MTEGRHPRKGRSQSKSSPGWKKRVSSMREVSRESEAWTTLTMTSTPKAPRIVPGSAFGENGKGFCRACFATSYEQLVEAATRIEQHVANVTSAK